MSASEALVTPTISALSASVTVTSPSFAFTSSALPVTFSIVPLRRCVCGCCAIADEAANAATRAAKIPILLIWFLRVSLFQKDARPRSAGRDVAAREYRQTARTLEDLYLRRLARRQTT